MNPDWDGVMKHRAREPRAPGAAPVLKGAAPMDQLAIVERLLERLTESDCVALRDALSRGRLVVAQVELRRLFDDLSRRRP